MLQGNETATTGKKKTQVYYATHNGEGASLPFMNRSFISFTYGGKKIEDFNLIATISGDRMSRSGYAPFEDTVTTYDNLDGHHYWATHYRANQMDFVLSTDGIDEQQLEQFKYWFKPGISRELILAEHPNRGIQARVAEPPTLNLLPFEQEVEIVISSDTYKTKTTLYKGDIQLKFVMDEPHWYGLTNILGKKETESGRTRYVDKWTNANGQEVNIFASQDALKILYEDGIPLGSMIEHNMLLGNGAYANVESNTSSKIWSKSENDQDFLSGFGAYIHGEKDGVTYVGIIAGAIVDANQNGITSLPNGIWGYFFYSGTAPSPTIISFTMTPQFDNYYISEPCNSYASTNNKNYNTFEIVSLTEQKLEFTTPNLFTSYNKVISIFENYVNGSHSREQIREVLRDNVRHPKVREYAIAVLNSQVSSNVTVNLDKKTVLQGDMKKFLIGDGSSDTGIKDVKFTFNSKTGEAIGEFECYLDGGATSTKIKEDVGDMLRSNYIIIQDRNYPTAQGKIEHWTNLTDTTKQYSHRISHDVGSGQNGLTNVQILYQNMYL